MKKGTQKYFKVPILVKFNIIELRIFKKITGMFSIQWKRDTLKVQSKLYQENKNNTVEFDFENYCQCNMYVSKSNQTPKQKIFRFAVFRYFNSKSPRILGKLHFDISTYFKTSGIQRAEVKMESGRSTDPALAIDWEVIQEKDIEFAINNLEINSEARNLETINSKSTLVKENQNSRIPKLTSKKEVQSNSLKIDTKLNDKNQTENRPKNNLGKKVRKQKKNGDKQNEKTGQNEKIEMLNNISDSNQNFEKLNKSKNDQISKKEESDAQIEMSDQNQVEQIKKLKKVIEDQDIEISALKRKLEEMKRNLFQENIKRKKERIPMITKYLLMSMGLIILIIYKIV